MATEIITRDPVKAVKHDLQQEFNGALPDDAIVVLAEEEVAAFENATVRDFVPVLAWRKARERAKRLVADRTG